LLGLAYFWTGSENGVCGQLWATWLLYAVLVDLTDAVADLCWPFGSSVSTQPFEPRVDRG